MDNCFKNTQMLRHERCIGIGDYQAGPGCSFARRLLCIHHTNPIGSNVWYIYRHLVVFNGNCRLNVGKLYHTLDPMNWKKAKSGQHNNSTRENECNTPINPKGMLAPIMGCLSWFQVATKMSASHWHLGPLIGTGVVDGYQNIPKLNQLLSLAFFWERYLRKRCIMSH